MKKSIVILLDGEFISGNSDPRVYRTILYLQKVGLEVTLICFKSNGCKDEEVLDGIRILRLFEPDITQFKSILGMRAQVAKKIVSILKFDYLLSNDHVMLNIASRIKRKKPNVTLIHDSHEFLQSYRLAFLNNESWSIRMKSKMWRAIEKFMEERDARVVDHWMTVDISLAAIFNRIYKLKRRATYVRNVPAFSEVSVPLSNFDQEVYQSLEAIKSSNNLIYIGYYVQHDSGLEAVIDSFEYLPSDTKLILLGSNWSKDYFNALIKQKGLSDRIVMVKRMPANYIPTVAKYAKIGVVPTIDDGTLSTYHSLPNKIFDYIKSNLPLLCTDIPEHVNIVENFNNGITVVNNSQHKAHQMAEAYKEIMRNYDTFQENAIKCANALSPEQEYKKLDKIFLDAV